MMKIYDKNFNFLYDINNYIYLQEIEELELGYKTINFRMPYDIYIQEEQKIFYNDYYYVVKEVNMENTDYYEVFCKPYFSSLLHYTIGTLETYNQNIEESLNEVLTNSGWKYYIHQPILGTHSLKINNKTLLESIGEIKELYNIELFYDTVQKVIHIWKTRTNKNIIFNFNKNSLRDCQVQSDTYDIITKLYPIGKNGINIVLVNNFCPYLENYDYTNEKIAGYYINTKIDSSELLLEKAKQVLEQSSRPHTNYKIKLTSIDNCDIGDYIHIIDAFKNVDTIQRVNKKVLFPLNQEKNYIEVGDPKIAFNNIYKMNDANQTILNILTDKDLTSLNNNVSYLQADVNALQGSTSTSK